MKKLAIALSRGYSLATNGAGPIGGKEVKAAAGEPYSI